MTYFSLVILYINMTEGGKRRANKSLKQWVAFVKKVAKEEGLEYKDAMKRAKARSDKGEKWQKGGNGDEPETKTPETNTSGETKTPDATPSGETQNNSSDAKPATGGRRQSRQGRRQSQRKGGRRQSRRNRRQSRRDRR